MAMKVLALCSQKGGVGKTTICGHLSVEAERTGFGPVALIDTDPQGSLASWWNERQAAEPQFAKVDITKLADLGWRDALRSDPALAKGLSTTGGMLTSEPVAAAWGHEFTSPSHVLTA